MLPIYSDYGVVDVPATTNFFVHFPSPMIGAIVGLGFAAAIKFTQDENRREWIHGVSLVVLFVFGITAALSLSYPLVVLFNALR